ncbi:hypothetical protein [Streptomyces sp. NPDC003697]
MNATPEGINDADKVGTVSADRYAETVAELRKLVETASRIQFTVGNYALEVEPMREAGGWHLLEGYATARRGPSRCVLVKGCGGLRLSVLWARRW